MDQQFDIEVLVSHHDRAGFSCGADEMDEYFKKQVSQGIRKRVANCYVAVDIINNTVAGFYTFSAASIPLTDVPVDLKKVLPRYPSVPVARLGRLAVNERYKGQKLGAALLWDAIERAKRSDLSATALIVDAKDENSKAFYIYNGFSVYGSLPLQLIFSFGKR